jgi:hypothetical protein
MWLMVSATEIWRPAYAAGFGGQEGGRMNIGKEIAILHGMTIRELREKHLEVFGDPTRAGHKQYLIRRIAWRMQSLAEGDLSERARRRAMELARDADIRRTIPRAHSLPPSDSPGGHASERTRVEHISIAPDDRLPLPGAAPIKSRVRGIPFFPGTFRGRAV